MIAELSGPIKPDPRQRALFGTLAELYEHKRPKLTDGYSRFYVAQFPRLFESLAGFLGREAEPGDLTPTTAEAFVEWLRPRFRPLTVRKYLTGLRRVWRELHAEYGLPPEDCDGAAARLPAVERLNVVAPPPAPKAPLTHRVRRAVTNDPFPLPADPAEQAGDLLLFMENVYAPIRMIGKRTRRRFRTVVWNLSRFVGRRAKVSDLTDTSIAAFLRHRLDAGKSAHSVDSDRNELVALANMAAKKRLLDEFPEIRPVPKPEIEPDAWTAEELQKLFQAATDTRGTIDGLPAADWFIAAFCVMLDCGERTEATMAIRWGWIDEASGRLLIPAAFRKKQRKSPPYVLRPETLRALDRLRRPDRQHVFLTPGGDKVAFVYARLRRLVARAGLDDNRRNRFQKLRRTFATSVAIGGGDATEALGHSSKRITERHYLDASKISRTAGSVFADNAMPFSSFMPERPTLTAEADAHA